MKKGIWIGAALAVFLAGCGPKPQPSEQAAGPRDYISEGMKYLSQSDIKRAIQSFGMAIRQDPSNPKNYMVLGEVYIRLKNYQGAVDSFAQAAKVDPFNGEAYYFLGMSRGLNGETKQAIEDVKKSIEIFVSKKDAAKFKSAVVLLKGLTEKEAANAQTPADVVNGSLATTEHAAPMGKNKGIE